MRYMCTDIRNVQYRYVWQEGNALYWCNLGKHQSNAYAAGWRLYGQTLRGGL